MKPMPANIKIVEAKHIKNFRLLISFSDGTKHEVDFGPFLKNSRNPQILKYANLQKFKKFSLEDGELMWGDFDLIFPLADLYQESEMRALATS